MKFSIAQRRLLNEMRRESATYIHPDYRPLKTLLEAGYIVSVGDDRYVITPRGRESLNDKGGGDRPRS